jgi:heat shock protein HtpX
MGAEPALDGAFPLLESLLEDLASDAGIPVPRLFIWHSDGANAFAAGDSPYVSVVGITTGALRRLEIPELRAALAHEVGHIVLGHATDRTATLMADEGLRRVARGHLAGVGLASLAGAFLPGADLAVRGLGLGVALSGTAMVKKAFEYNRTLEHDADDFATRAGSGHALAGSLFKLARANDPARMPDWASSMSFLGRLDTRSHPPNDERIRKALTSHPNPEACSVCAGRSRRCLCGKGGLEDAEACDCGARPRPADRFCADCGREIHRAMCRSCGHRPEQPDPFCARCGLPLP